MDKSEIEDMNILVDRCNAFNKENTELKKRVIYLESVLHRLQFTLRYDLELIENTIGKEEDNETV